MNEDVYKRIRSAYQIVLTRRSRLVQYMLAVLFLMLSGIIHLVDFITRPTTFLAK
jgi:hypothetical protein